MEQLTEQNLDFRVAYLSLMAGQPVREFEINITHCEKDKFRAARVSIAHWRTPRGTSWPIRLLNKLRLLSLSLTGLHKGKLAKA